MPIFSKKKTTNLINSHIRNFIWDPNEEHRKIHLINYNLVTQPKSEGGLHLKDAYFQNQAFAVGLAWRFINHLTSSPWPSILHAKYISKEAFHPFRIPNIKSSDSPIWKFLIIGWTLCQEHIKWAMGNGKSIYSWSDNWIDTLSTPLVSNIIGPLNKNDHNLKVSSLICSGNWHLDRISFPLAKLA